MTPGTNTALPPKDPFAGNWFASPGPTDPCWWGLDRAFWASLPDAWRGLQNLNGLARLAAYNQLAAVGPATLANGRQIADPRLMAYAQSPYGTTRMSKLYLAIEPAVVFPNGYPALWNSSTDIEDFPAWAPPVVTHAPTSPIGIFEGNSPINGLPRFSRAPGDTHAVGAIYVDAGTGHEWMLQPEGEREMMGEAPPVFWFQVK